MVIHKRRYQIFFTEETLTTGIKIYRNYHNWAMQSSPIIMPLLHTGAHIYTEGGISKILPTLVKMETGFAIR